MLPPSTCTGAIFKLSLGMMKTISPSMFLKMSWVAKGKAVSQAASQAAQSIRKGQIGDVMEARIKVLSSMEVVGNKSHGAVDSTNQQTSTTASVKLRENFSFLHSSFEESMTKLGQMEEVRFIRTKKFKVKF